MAEPLISRPDTGRAIHIRLSHRQRYVRLRRAVILSQTGGQVRTFSLLQEENELSLHDISPGIYSLRVELGEEVTVCQFTVAG